MSHINSSSITLKVPVLGIGNIQATLNSLANLDYSKVGPVTIEIDVVNTVQGLDLIATLRKEVDKIMADLSKLATAFTQFASDFSKFKTDLTTFLGTIKPEDPAVQQQIDGFTSSLTDMDNSVQQMDASLQPSGGGTPPPTPQP